MESFISLFLFQMKLSLGFWPRAISLSFYIKTLGFFLAELLTRWLVLKASGSVIGMGEFLMRANTRSFSFT
jgi:hypothetical protein